MIDTRLGVFGGSFNPVHLGHLHIAQQSSDIFGLSRVLFVVASLPPHKPCQELVSFTHRYAMVALATSGRERFLPSPVEWEPPASPYSVETLAKLARRFRITGKELYFIAGEDSLLDIAGWHEGERLLVSYNFIFISRPGVATVDICDTLPLQAASRVVDCRELEGNRLRTRVATETAAPGCRIFVLNAGAPDIAASQIRMLISTGRSIDRLVPAPVHDYIRKLHLFGE